MNNKPLLHKDSYEPVSMMECHKGFERRSIEMFSFICHGSTAKFPWHKKLPLEISHFCHDKLSFFMPQNHKAPFLF